jgi:lipopolysaccharide transport system permease protein
MPFFDLRTHFSALSELIFLLTRRRQLLWAMVKREIGEQYAGQVIGSIWSIGHPLILMLIYVVVFSFIFKMKLGGTTDHSMNYPIYMLSGLIPWMTFQTCLSKGAGVICANSNLVKQVVFPIEILPVKTVLASSISQGISLLLLTVYVLIVYRTLPWTYVLLPTLIFTQILGMIGVAYVLSAVGVYFRDLKEFVQVFLVAGIYAMPIFYLPEMVPSALKPVLYLNPFSHMVWCYQDALYFGSFRHPYSWGIFFLISSLSFYGGYRIFRKLKVFFGSVL